MKNIHKYRLNQNTPMKDRRKILVAQILELAAADAMRDMSRVKDKTKINLYQHWKNVAVRWLDTVSFVEYCNDLNVSPAKIRRGIKENMK